MLFEWLLKHSVLMLTLDCALLIFYLSMVKTTYTVWVRDFLEPDKDQGTK